MIQRPRATAALLAALLLSAAMPAAAIQAASPTPLDTNLLRNSGFGMTPTESSPVPRWTAEGDVRVETFGTRSWPYPAYGKKWGGGTRYLACGKKSGLVRQTVDFDWAGRSVPLKVRLRADFGGTIDHEIYASIVVTGQGHKVVMDKHKVMDITHHYKVIVAGNRLPLWAEHLEVTLELIRRSGASSCKMVADTVSLIVSRID